MNHAIRIARGTFEVARRETLRTHPVAHERVGFLWGRNSAFSGQNALVLLTDFTPVDDGHYLEDDSVGARISSAAIRAALARVLETGECCFHFHLHTHVGVPSLSRTDATELGRLLPTFGNAAPAAKHGAVIGSLDSASAWVWTREVDKLAPVAAVSLVGFPTELWRP